MVDNSLDKDSEQATILFSVLLETLDSNLSHLWLQWFVVHGVTLSPCLAWPSTHSETDSKNWLVVGSEDEPRSCPYIPPDEPRHVHRGATRSGVMVEQDTFMARTCVHPLPLSQIVDHPKKSRGKNQSRVLHGEWYFQSTRCVLQEVEVQSGPGDVLVACSPIYHFWT